MPKYIEYRQLNEDEILDEFNIRSLGKNIVNKTLGKLGNGKAQGRFELQKTTDKLMNDFNKYLGHQKGAQPTLQTVQTYLSKRFGQDFATQALQAAQSTKPAATQGGGGERQEPTLGGETSNQQEAPAPATKPELSDAEKQQNAQNQYKVGTDTGAYATMSRKNGGVNANRKNYQIDTLSQINKAAQSSDIRSVVTLTKELVAHANDHGGGDKARVVAYLKKIRSNPNIASNPKISAFLQNAAKKMQTESFQKIVDMAIYLVENEISSKQGLTESYKRFFLKEFQDTSAAFSRKQLFGIFQAVASNLLAAGAVKFRDKNDRKNNDDEDDGGYQNQNQTTSGQQKQEPTLNKQSIDKNLLLNNIKAMGVTSAERDYIVPLLVKGRSLRDIVKDYKKAGKQLSDEAYVAISDTKEGKKSSK